VLTTRRFSTAIFLTTFLATLLGLAACSGSSNSPAGSAANPGAAQPSGSGEAPVAPEKNPVGDIPDNQAYVAFKSNGFELKVPEGWGRTDGTNAATFTDRLNTIHVSWQAATAAPSADRAKTQDVPELQRTQAAFTLRKVSEVKLTGGAAVLIESQENSAPNSVTGKQYRLDVQRYVFFHNGQQATVALSSPVGADNVDPWKLVSESFKWQ
jgi:hypothetical protein